MIPWLKKSVNRPDLLAKPLHHRFVRERTNGHDERSRQTGKHQRLRQRQRRHTRCSRQCEIAGYLDHHVYYQKAWTALCEPFQRVCVARLHGCEIKPTKHFLTIGVCGAFQFNRVERGPTEGTLDHFQK